MGSDNSTPHSFIPDNWDLVQRSPSYTLWRSRTTPHHHIEQHQIYSKDSQQHTNQQQTNNLRHNHAQLVSTIFYSSQTQKQFCSSSHHNTVFLERIPIRLSDIQHIPYPDYIHLYWQTIKGYQIITQKYGFFEVQEEYIGVNQNSVVKVWLNQDYSKNYVIGGKIKEEHMVRSIVEILDKNCDHYHIGNIPSLKNYLYRNSDVLRFNQIIRQLEEYTRIYNEGRVPNKLECIDRAGGIYQIANRLTTEPPNSARLQLESPRNHNMQHQRPRMDSERQIQAPTLAVQGPPVNTHTTTSVAPLGLRASQAFPHPSRQISIVNPHDVRSNMQIIRRRKSDYQQGYDGRPHIGSPNPMRQSQDVTIQPTFLSPQKPLQQSTAQQGHVTFGIPPTQMRGSDMHNVSQNHLPPNTTNSNLASERNSQPFTFKLLNNATQRGQMKNSSLASLNFNNNTHRNSISIPQPQRLPHQATTQSQISPAPTPQIQSQQTSQRTASTTNHIRTPSNFSQQSQPQPHVITHTPEHVLAATQQALASGQQNSNHVIDNERNNREDNNHMVNTFNPQNSSNNANNINNHYTNTYNNVNTNNNTYNTTVSEPKQYTTTYNYTLQGQKPSQSKPSSSKAFQNYTISAQDGKSSAEFMQKLRQMTSSTTQNHTTSTYTQEKPTHDLPFDNKYSYQPELQPTNMRADNQEFGRNAVSNIIQSYQSAFNSRKMSGVGNHEPFKFENGIPMKYSRLEDDNDLNFKSSPGKYDFDMDADIMADLKKIKEQ